eukprot:TRINITY_DN11483_c0_g1_i1.p1 TRINITY_DN11483_c0_g1~~TRINITY_DN11483_c0_g1_i1.p1  ORF type:complete len:398 (+),score=49.26 TRINITY_DN11483_c0_g1_i1:15-1208(+)
MGGYNGKGRKKKRQEREPETVENKLPRLCETNEEDRYWQPRKVGDVVRLILMGASFDDGCVWATLPREVVNLVIGFVLPQRSMGVRSAFLRVGRNIVSTYPDITVNEFVDIWVAHLPPPVRSFKGSTHFEMHVCLNLEKVRWQVACPIAHLDKMIDFFLLVGAPETEVESLKSRLASLSPPTVGYYIEMSKKRGMDGGWFLLGDYQFDKVSDCLEEGMTRSQIESWVKGMSPEDRCHFFGRDVGSSPPRQCEFRFLLPGDTFTEQMRVAEELFVTLGVPFIVPAELSILTKHPPTTRLHLTVIAVQHGIVQLGLVVPMPSEDLYAKLCQYHRVEDRLQEYQTDLGFLLPSFVEFRYLMPGFGYNVYDEGHTTHFIYTTVEEYQQVVREERLAAEARS